jgi:hypothetical protein
VKYIRLKTSGFSTIFAGLFLLFGIGGLYGSGLALTGQATEPSSAEERPDKRPAVAATKDSREAALSTLGPWGQLETFEVLLEAPVDLLRASEPKSVRTRWFFAKMNGDAVAELIQRIVRKEELARKLCDLNRWLEDADGVSVFPRTEDLLQMEEAARAEMYAQLAKFQENPFHVEPEILYGGSFEEWAGGVQISETARNFIKTLSYRRGSMLQFSDLPALLGVLPTEQERIEALRALSRTPSLVAKIIINQTPTEKLAAYWHKGFRLKDTSSFMASVKQNKNVDRMDLMHLLPSGIRKILYTFPDPTQARSGYLPDCHWSALNFFNTQPLDRLADPIQATAYTLEKFTPIEPPYELGDVLFFTDTRTGDAYHSCVYIADNVVFTKNGRSPLQPWVLMKLASVKELYDMHFRTKVSAYRRKDMMEPR